MTSKTKLNLLKAGGVISSLAPLGITIGISIPEYVQKNNGSVLSLTIGGIIAIILIAVSVLGRLKLPGRIWFFALLFLMVCLLEPVLADLKLLSGMALAGEGINSAVFSPQVKRMTEQTSMEKQAKVIDDYFQRNPIKKKSGRV